jgi:hypothetical protein
MYVKLKAENRKEEWNLHAMQDMVALMPSREKERWLAHLDSMNCEMEYWPIELYKFMINRWNEIEREKVRNMSRRARRAYRGELRRGSGNNLPIQPTSVSDVCSSNCWSSY